MNQRFNLLWSVFLIGWISISSVHSYAQDSLYLNEQEDSLISLVQQSTDLLDRSRIYNDIAKFYADTNSSLGIVYADSSYQLAITNEFYPEAVSALNSKALILLGQKQFESSLQVLDEVKALFDDQLSDSLKVNSPLQDDYLNFLDTKGRNIYYLRDYYAAFLFFNQAYENCVKYGFDKVAPVYLMRIGVVANEVRDYDLAMEYYNKSIGELEKINDPIRLATVYNNIGDNLYTREQYSEALVQLDKALALRKQGEHRIYAVVLYNKGECNFELNQMNEAAINFAKSYDIYMKNGEDGEAAYCTAYLARIRFLNGNNSKVESDLRNSFNVAVTYEHRDLQLICSNALSDFYKRSGNYLKASEQMAKSLELEESIHDDALSLKLRTVDAKNKFLVEKKEALLKSELSASSKINKLLLGLISVFVLGGVLLFRAYKTTLGVKKQLQINYAALEKTEERLSQSNTDMQKHIKLNKELEQFAYIASHDIKAPFRTITSYCTLLKRKYYDAAGEKEKLYFDFVQKSTSSLNLLVDDLLEFANSNTQLLTTENLFVNDIIDEVIQNLDFSIGQANAEIKIENCDFHINADYIKLKQILQNIISNALKFKSVDRSPIITISAHEDHEYLYLSIKDNGIGIAKEDFKQVFDKFTRLNSQDKFEGSGLGLSICAKYVKKHNGSIKIERNNDFGVTFTFSIDKSLPLS